jgi:hypothetical protein
MDITTIALLVILARAIMVALLFLFAGHTVYSLLEMIKCYKGAQ